MNIYEFLHDVKLYREYIVYKEISNGHTSLSERAELDETLKNLGRKIDIVGYHFRNMDCNDCANKKTCTMPKQPSLKCFEYEFTPRS